MPPVKRPHPFEYIKELATHAPFDPELSLKDQLNAIDDLADRSQSFKDDDDLENAYISLGRAATIINVHLPNHSEYDMLPSKERVGLTIVRLPMSLSVLAYLIIAFLVCSQNGRLVLHTLRELEMQLKVRYLAFQESVTNGTLEPPQRWDPGEEESWKVPIRSRSPAAIIMPRTPPSIGRHPTRSFEPTLGVSRMLSEAQGQARLDQLDAERHNWGWDYNSGDDPQAKLSPLSTAMSSPSNRQTSTLSPSSYTLVSLNEDRSQEGTDSSPHEFERSDRLVPDRTSPLRARNERSEMLLRTVRFHTAVELKTKSREDYDGNMLALRAQQDRAEGRAWRQLKLDELRQPHDTLASSPFPLGFATSGLLDPPPTDPSQWAPVYSPPSPSDIITSRLREILNSSAFDESHAALHQSSPYVSPPAPSLGNPHPMPGPVRRSPQSRANEVSPADALPQTSQPCPDRSTSLFSNFSSSPPIRVRHANPDAQPDAPRRDQNHQQGHAGVDTSESSDESEDISDNEEDPTVISSRMSALLLKMDIDASRMTPLAWANAIETSHRVHFLGLSSSWHLLTKNDNST